MQSVDWSNHDRWPEYTVTCRCGASYRSHTKAVSRSDGFLIVTRKPCPGCGQTEGNATSARSDPETMTIRKES